MGRSHVNTTTFQGKDLIILSSVYPIRILKDSFLSQMLWEHQSVRTVVELKESLKKQFQRFQILDLLFHTDHFPKSSFFLNLSCQRTRISKALTRRQVLQSEVCNFSVLLCKYGPHKHSYTNLMDLEIEAEEMQVVSQLHNSCKKPTKIPDAIS